MKQTFYCFLFLFSLGRIFSQAHGNEQKVKSALEDYFYFERENIHVQFNKNLYVSNEQIAFKGYIFNKQNALPNIKTTNIQLVIYDAKGTVVQKELLSAALGTFEGVVQLKESLSSGNYRFHFYTNWMNNFKEDESFEHTIEIVNKKENYQLTNKDADYKSASINLYPESGTLLKDIKNAIGVRVKDCNDIGIQIPKATVFDSKGNVVVSFFTNKMGYGRFDFVPVPTETYTVKITNDKLNLSQPLPAVQNSGLVISPNNNLPDNVLEVTVNTNSSSVALYQNKNYTLVIHQNANLVQKSFNFNDKNPSQSISFDKSTLANGVNTIRIIDENSNQIAERLIYINKLPKAVPQLEAQLTSAEKVTLFGKIESQNANLSISVLPAETVSLSQNNSILGTFFLNAYLEKPEQNNFTYFDLANKYRANDLELLMLSKAKSKYEWNNILMSKPKETSAFTKGVTISGTIVKELNPKTKYKVALISIKNNIFEEAPVDKNNKFIFENFFAQDSTAYTLELMDEANKPIETKITTNILYGDQAFNKKLLFEPVNCAPQKATNYTFAFKTPADESSLKEVMIKNTYKKPVMTHEKESNNMMAKGYKISDTEFGNILQFLGRNGYHTGVDDEFNAYVTDTRYANTANATEYGVPGPAVFIDNVQVRDLNVLFELDVKDADEIYTDKTGSSNVSTGGLGTIKIYLKSGAGQRIVRKKHTTLIVKSGFAKPIPYTSTDYVSPKEFMGFGTIDWSPNVFSDANQSFSIPLQNKGPKEITVFVEGFTIEGQFVSEIRKVAVAPKL